MSHASIKKHRRKPNTKRNVGGKRYKKARLPRYAASSGRTVYTVLRIDGHSATIQNTNYKKKAATITVYTRDKLRAGQKVRIGLATKEQIVAEFLCMAVPLLCAVSALLCAEHLARLLCIPLSSNADKENFRAICTVAAIIVSSTIAGIIARHRRSLVSDRLQVVEVLS